MVSPAPKDNSDRAEKTALPKNWLQEAITDTAVALQPFVAELRQAIYALPAFTKAFLRGDPPPLHEAIGLEAPLSPDDSYPELDELCKLSLERQQHYLLRLSQYQSPGTTLDDDQKLVFADLANFLEGDSRRGFVKYPTGGGKTVIISELVEARGCKALVVVPTKDLVTQTKAEFETFAQSLQVGMWYSDKKEFGDDVTITTYDSFINLVREGAIKKGEFPLIILDEAHEALGRETKNALKRVSGKQTTIIGFTATPTYSETRGVEELLPTVIHWTSLRELQQRGRLCPHELIEVCLPINIANAFRGLSVDERMFQKIADQARLNERVIEVYKSQVYGKKAIAFCSGVDHAKKLAEDFREKAISAVAIWGNDPEREEKLRCFKNNLPYDGQNIQILTGADLVVQGLDIRDLEVGFLLAPTCSPVVAEQRIGRLLRTDPNNPSKRALLFEFRYTHTTAVRALVTASQILLQKAQRYLVAEGNTLRPASNYSMPSRPSSERGSCTYTWYGANGEMDRLPFPDEITAVIESWPEAEVVSRQIGIPTKAIEAFAKRSNNGNLSIRKQEPGSRGRSAKLHCSPDLIEHIRKCVGDGIAPHGWIRKEDIVNFDTLDPQQRDNVQRLEGHYKREYFVCKNGFMFYSPELKDRILGDRNLRF